MAVTTTNRLGLSKPDNDELVSIALINANMDKVDADFRPACLLRATVNQATVHAGAVTQAYDNIAHDTYSARPEGPMADLTNDRIIIRKTGLYMCGAGTSWGVNGGGYRRIRLMKNATQFTVERKLAHNTVGEQNTISTHIPHDFIAGDLITAEALQTSGGALNITPEGTSGSVFLYAYYVGSLV